MMATVFSVANDVVTNPNSGTQVFLQTIFVCPVGYDDPMPTTPNKPKAPMHAPEVYLEGHTLNFSYNIGYTLELIDTSMGDEGTIIYTAVIPEDFSGIGRYSCWPPGPPPPACPWPPPCRRRRRPPGPGR